jgi:uncharacterized protein (UPF0216 family)
MRQNLHTQTIPQDVLEQAQAKLDEVNNLLSPYFLSLTSQERRSLLIMGDKTVAFVDKALNFAQQNPLLVPAYLNLREFEIDKVDASSLRVILNTAKQIVQGLDDTEMVSGSEAYQAALTFYNSVKLAAEHDIYGAKAVYEDLRKRFPSGKRKPSNVESETFTETMKKEIKVSEE